VLQGSNTRPRNTERNGQAMPTEKEPRENQDEPEARRSKELMIAHRNACAEIGAMDLPEAKVLMNRDWTKRQLFADKMAEQGF